MTTSPHDSPIPVAPLGDASAGVVLFRFRGETRLTIIAKAQLQIVHGADMRLIHAEPLILDDVHRGGHPGQSLLAASEVAPRVPNVEVLLTGHARPSSGPQSSLLVRLVMGRGAALLLNKSIRVQGNWPDDRAEPQPFEHMPLVYEHAFGGIESQDNPAGTSAPNLLDARGRPRPACFAPIPRRWPSRAMLEGGDSAFDGGVMELAEGFDWSYFQASPLDQRIDALLGGEVVIAEGLHPTIPRVESRLPPLTGAARVYGPPGAPDHTFELRADTLILDMDRMIATVLFRADIPLAHHDIAVAAGVGYAGQALSWPPRRPARAAPPQPTAPIAAPVQSTVVLQPSGAARSPVLPFGRGIEAPSDSSRRTIELSPAKAAAPRGPALPFRERPKEAAREGVARDLTTDLTTEHVASLIAAAKLPFEPPSGKAPVEANAPPSAPARGKPDFSDATLELTTEMVAADIAAAKSAASSLPFDKKRRAQHDMSSMERTLDLTTEQAAAQAAVKLPFAQTPYGRGGGTVQLDPAVIARLSPKDVLPFEQDSGERPFEPAPPAPPIAPSPVMAPPVMASPIAAPPIMAPPVMASPVEPAPADKAPPPAPEAPKEAGRRRPREKKIDLAGHFLAAVDEVERSSKDDPHRR